MNKIIGVDLQKTILWWKKWENLCKLTGFAAAQVMSMQKCCHCQWGELKKGLQREAPPFVL